VDISKASFPSGILLMTSARSFFLGSLYFLQDCGDTFVVDDILLYIGFGIAETIANQFVHFLMNNLPFSGLIQNPLIHPRLEFTRILNGCIRGIPFIYTDAKHYRVIVDSCHPVQSHEVHFSIQRSTKKCLCPRKTKQVFIYFDFIHDSPPLYL
jgi:hypothetical protein